MRVYDIIRKKRDGETLTPEEIEFFVNGYTKGEIPDYQASALTMAIFFQGMNDEETANLTMAMANSGQRMEHPSSRPTVDKHSTGGVGDKTTLIVAPIVSACGIPIAKMSGRGLGHTGGTTDKLSSIPGFRVDLNAVEIENVSSECGLCVTGSTGDLAPADKKLYALRDVTATVDSIPLIAASIMSKKIAGGAKNIVLDVKTGSGAFMKDYEGAKALAKAMVQIGTKQSLNITALITNMDTPLGNAIGNSLEVIEAVQTLSGNGPSDLLTICLELSAHMLMLCGKGTYEECYKQCETVLNNGSALQKFIDMVDAQSGNSECIHDLNKMPKAEHSIEFTAPTDGYIHHLHAEKCGIAAMLLGAGRKTKEDTIDLTAGILLHKKPGQKVAKGDVLATLYAKDASLFQNALDVLSDAYTFSDIAPEPVPMVFDCITNI